MPTIPLLDVVVEPTREPDVQIKSIRRSLKHTGELIMNSRQHVKESHDALRRADEQIRGVARSEVK